MRLWSTARFDLGLSEGDFWRLTGRQLSALMRRLKAGKDREHMLVGIIASTTANFSMCRPKEPLTVADFMPGRGKPRIITEDEIAEDLAMRLSFALPATSPTK
jgi:hypothetical protein